MRPRSSLIHAALLAVADSSPRARAVPARRTSSSSASPRPSPVRRRRGHSHKQATELIFEEINNQGGLEVGGKKYKLEVIAYDHKYVIAEASPRSTASSPRTA